MKISVSDLKKALKWVEEHSNDNHVNLHLIDQLTIGCKDKYQAQVEIVLYEDSMMLPKIRKEDVLK